MPEPIKNIQNSEESLHLLAAQRQIYNEAKRINAFLFALAVLSALVIPIVLAIFPNVDKFWGLAGLGIFFINRQLKSIEKRKREMASKIQEQFDTKLFGIPWNRSLAGEEVPPELIVAADNRFKGDREKLKHWYNSAKFDLPSHLIILLCQRENFVWEYRQRQLFIRWLSALFVLLVAAALILGLYKEVSLLDFLLEYVSPVLPLLALIGDAWLSHKKTEGTLRQKASEITESLISGEYASEEVSREKIRDFQDAVLKNRQTGPMIPNWFFRRLGTSISKEIDQATQMIIGRLAPKI